MLSTKAQTGHIDHLQEWFYFLRVCSMFEDIASLSFGAPWYIWQILLFLLWWGLPAKQNWRLEATSPSMLPKSAADRVRRLLVITNAPMEHIRGMHKSLDRQIHPDKCGNDPWLHSMRCNHLTFFNKKVICLYCLERNNKAPTPWLTGNFVYIVLSPKR